MQDDALTAVPWLPALSGAPQDLLVIAVNTPDTTIRDGARRQIRTAIGKLLGLRMGPIAFNTGRGQAPRFAAPHDQIGLSISHEAGLSLAGINFSGPVGIDLMRVINPEASRDNLPAIARDYLGPQCAKSLKNMDLPAQTSLFAERWTAHEASLKCLGLGLQEWNPELARQLAACTIHSLQLPGGYIGSLATLPRQAPSRPTAAKPWSTPRQTG